MSDTAIVELLKTIVTLVTLYYAYKARKQSVSNAVDIKEVRTQTNHIKDELVAATQKSAEAEGNLAGRKELKAEQSEAQIFPPPH